MKAIIAVGISASGKTTWAKEYAKSNKAIISNRDDLRFSLTGLKIGLNISLTRKWRVQSQSYKGKLCTKLKDLVKISSCQTQT